MKILGSIFIRDFKTPAKTPSQDEIDQLSNQITTWRKQLPVEIIRALQDEWTSDNVLVLVLLAMGYRLEAVFCRAAKGHYRSRKDSGSTKRMAQRQENAMFELSTVIQRASMHEVLHLCPLSLLVAPYLCEEITLLTSEHYDSMTCASTNLAMRIELALDPAITPQKLVATKAQIFAELEYVRESCEYWNSLIWTVRMFEAVLARTRLSPMGPSPNEASEGDDSTPSTNTLVNNSNFQDQQTACSDNGLLEESHEVDFSLPMADDFFGILPVTDNYDWLESLFGVNTTDATDAFGSIS